MPGPVSSDPYASTDAVKGVMRVIEPITAKFPISQLVVPLQEILEWLLDDASSDEYRQSCQQAFHALFAERWKLVSDRALNPDPRQVSEMALADPDYDPLHGRQPWGCELTRAFRAAFAELGPTTGPVPHILPDSERLRAFARVVGVHGSEFVLPVVSFAPFLESEWETILERLDDIVNLTLKFEGALVVWLIGGFYRDVNGRLTLHPQLSLAPPPSGTRVKPIHVLLGTDYGEQCPSVAPLVQQVRAGGRYASGFLFEESRWHRIVLQLDMAVDDYVLLNLDRLSDNEREMSRQVMYIEQRPRASHTLQGVVQDVIRPWQRHSSGDPAPVPPVPALATQTLSPRAAVLLASHSYPGEQLAALSATEELSLDADQLRRKGMDLADNDPAAAQKYLLASTVLDNTSVDVWLKLVELAPTERQRSTFQREAEKVLKRQRQDE